MYDEEEYITFGEWLSENALSILFGIIMSIPVIIVGLF